MVNYTTTDVPVIGVNCDKYDQTNDTKASLVERTLGTTTEHAFDVVIVDRTARKLNCVRIGAKALGGNGAAGNDQVDMRVVYF